VKPDEMIDMATPPGACVMTLGPPCSGLLANDQGLAGSLLHAAQAAGENVWRLPLIDECRGSLKGEIADLNNVGPRGGGVNG
jgi:leucyl aminopeptidase